MLTFAPSEIRQANLARLMLKRRFKKYTKPQIRDARIPRRPPAAPLRFYKERWASGDYVHLAAPEVVKLLVKEYRDLSPEQKKVNAEPPSPPLLLTALSSFFFFSFFPFPFGASQRAPDYFLGPSNSSLLPSPLSCNGERV